MNIDDTDIDFSPGGDDGPPKSHACPKCGESKDIEVTLVAILGDIDTNKAQCHACGWKGIAHDLGTPMLTVKNVMEDAQDYVDELIQRGEDFDVRIHNVFELVNLLATAINVMMTRQQLNVPVPQLGMRTVAELFKGDDDGPR